MADRCGFSPCHRDALPLSARCSEHITEDAVVILANRCAAAEARAAAAEEKAALPTGDVVEHLAAVQHEIWSHWMRWFFGNDTEDNRVRWRRQMVTPYSLLSERERESDRKVVRDFLGQFIAALAASESARLAAEEREKEAEGRSLIDKAEAEHNREKWREVAAERERLRAETVGALTTAGVYMLVDADPTGPGEVRSAIKRLAAARDAALRERDEARVEAARWRSELSAACELSERARQIVQDALNQPPEYHYDHNDNGQWGAEHAAHAIRILFEQRDKARKDAEDLERECIRLEDKLARGSWDALVMLNPDGTCKVCGPDCKVTR